MTDKKQKEGLTDTKQSDIICCGLDIGTGNFACARSDLGEVKILRNAFLKVDKDNIDTSTLSGISCVQNQEGEIFIIGQDAFSFANIFGQHVLRPMEKGLISPKEIDSLEIQSLMIKNLIGDVPENKKIYVNYGIPAESIDEERNVLYHEQIFSRILKGFGFEAKSVLEGMAVIYSECAKENFTGIGISWGAGMTNVVVGYKGVPAAKFATARGGDFIDNQCAQNLNSVPNRISAIKEKYLSFETENDFTKEPDKKRRRILEALTYHYSAMMEYTIKKLVGEFTSNLDLDISEPLPIILSGGTAMVPGFLEKFKTILSTYKLPFEISEIREARNKLTAVATGLLVKSMSDVS
jgi:hypothetical protein